jgi:hypothetical protein
MKMAVFWVVAPCSLDCGLITLMIEAASTSEKSVNVCQTTRRYNREDSHFRVHTYFLRPFIKYDTDIADEVQM